MRVLVTGAGTFHDYTVKNCTDSQLVNSADINAFATATFGKGIKPGSIVASAMADEPAILMQNVHTPLDKTSVPLHSFDSHSVQRLTSTGRSRCGYPLTPPPLFKAVGLTI